MQIQVYVTGERQKVGRWLSLPVSVHDLKQALAEITDGNEACVIRDLQAPFTFESNDILAINQAVIDLAEYDHRLVIALCGCIKSIEQIIRILNSGSYRVLYGVDSLYDVAEVLMRPSHYGRGPDAHMRHIDIDRIICDLVAAGWYFQPDVHVAIQPL